MKQFTSWGSFVDVFTSEKVFENVVICPVGDDASQHVLEYSNGDTLRIQTHTILKIERKRENII